jgi:hypothetical protein
MAITLDDLTLPPDLLWQDELEHCRATAFRRRTLQGRLVLHVAAWSSDSGRALTLGNEHAWISRADLLTLHAWSHTPGRRMTLTLHDGRGFSVLFRHWDAPVLEAEAVTPMARHEDSDMFKLLSLKLVCL